LGWLFKSLEDSSFNDTDSFKQSGLVSKVCGWYFRGSEGTAWILALRVHYGERSTIFHGPAEEVMNSTYGLDINKPSKCIPIAPHRVTHIYLTQDLFVDQLHFFTDDGNTQSLISGPTSNAMTTEKPRQVGDFLGPFLGWEFTSADAVARGLAGLAGLQFQWMRELE
jgi:hypothetical protein